MPTRRALLASPLALAAAPPPVRAAAPIKLGLLHTLSPAPLYIAMERGYFHDEGADVTFSFFQAAQPIAAAAVSGDLQMGITALTGGFFSLAGRGLLKVVAGGLHEEPGWPGIALLASRQAYAAGLTTPAKLGAHSFGITQFGSSFHYMIGQIATKEGFDLKTINLRPLQTIQNMVAAVRTGQVDASMAIASQARPVDASGDARIIAWVGDIVPYQLTAMFAPKRMLAERRDDVARVVRAYQRGVADYRHAFLRKGPDGKPIADASTDAAIAAITKYIYTGDPAARAKILEGIGWYDKDAALDIADVENQVRWFRAQGMIHEAFAPSSVIDPSFVPPLQA